MAVQELLVRLGLDDANFSKKMKAIDKQVKSLDTQLNTASLGIKNFDKTFYGLNKTMDTAKQKQELFADKLKLVQQEIDLYNSKLKQHKGEVEKYSAKKKELEERLTQAGLKFGELSEATDKSAEALKKPKEELKVLNEEFKKNKETLKLAEKTYNGFENSMKKGYESIAKCKKEIETFTNRIDANKRSIEYLTNENKKLDKELISTGKNYNKVEKELSKVNKKLEEQTQKLEDGIARYKEGSKRVETYKKNVEELKEEKKRLTTELNKVKTSMNNLGKALNSNSKDIDKFERQNETAKNKIQLLNSEITRYGENLVKIKLQQREHIGELQKAQAEYNETKPKVEALRKEVQALEEQFKDSANMTKSQKEAFDLINKELVQYTQLLDKAQKNMQSAGQSVNRLDKEFVEVTNQLKKTNVEMLELERNMRTLKFENFSNLANSVGGSLEKIGSGMRNLGTTLTMGVSVPLATFGATAGKTFMDFEKQMRRVNATFGGTSEGMGKQFDYISEKARKFGRETEWTAGQVGEAYQYMAMAGWNVEKSTESMTSLLSLASIGMLDLGLASDIVTDTITPFGDHLNALGESAKANGKEFNEAEYMVDVFAQTIRRSNTSIELMGETLKYSASIGAEAGASFEDMAIAIGIMGNAGVKGSMAGTSLAQGITRLLAPTEKATSLMEEFDIQIAKNSDGSMNLDGTIRNLQKAFQGMSHDAKVANAKVIFGQTALKGWLPLITASSQEYDKLSDSIRNSAGATKEMMDEIEKSGSYQFSIMISAIQDFLIVVGDALAPAMKDVAEMVVKMTTKLSDWVTKMKETNPELLSFIGKMGLLAVVIPPIIMALGMFTQGLGSIITFSGTVSKALGKIKGKVFDLEKGMIKLEGKTGALVGKFTKLGGALTSTTALVTAGVVALVGMAGVVGENEDALAWLINKWGALGTAVGVVCEFCAGIVQVTIGNIVHLIKGLGKTISAGLKLQFHKIDDIWAETWADMENTTARAMSNIFGETSRAYSKLNDLTSSEIGELKNTYEYLLSELPKTTADNVGEMANIFTEKFKDIDNDTVAILRGTSDTMAMLFDQISQNTPDMGKQFRENLESMVRTGKVSTDVLQKDFEKAFSTIDKLLKDSAYQVQGYADTIVYELSQVGKKSTEDIIFDLARQIEKMDDVTFSELSKLGTTWETAFGGIKNIASLSTHDIAEILRGSISTLGLDTKEGVDKLIQELSSGIKNISDKTSETVNGMVDETTKATQTMSDNVLGVISLLRDNSTTDLDTMATNILATLQGMGQDTINSLSETSDYWYGILHGVTSEGGQLTDDMKWTILGNLTHLGITTPEKMQEFANKLEEGLIGANIKVDEQTKGINNTVTENAEALAEDTKDVGQKIANNYDVSEASTKIKEELEKANVKLKEENAKLQQEAETLKNDFNTKLSELGKDIDLSNIGINTEEFGVQFSEAGKLAIIKFAEGWSNNMNLLSEAISISLDGTDTIISSLSGSIDTMATKIGLVSDALAEVNQYVLDMNNTGFTGILGNVEALKSSVSETKKEFFGTREEVNRLSTMQFTQLTNEVKTTKTETVDLTNKTKDSKKEMDKLVSVKFKSLLDNLNDAKGRIDGVKNSSNSAISRLKDLGNVSFYNTINGLSRISGLLSDISYRANNTSYSLSTIKPPATRGYSEYMFDTDTLRNISRDNLRLDKYKTSGGFYSSNSMAGYTSRAKEIESQNELLSETKKMNELLISILASQNQVNISLDLDGRQIGKASAKYVKKEIEAMDKRSIRLGGAF